MLAIRLRCDDQQRNWLKFNRVKASLGSKMLGVHINSWIEQIALFSKYSDAVFVTTDSLSSIYLPMVSR